MMIRALLLVLAMSSTAQAGESKAYKAEKKAGKNRIYEICGFSAPRVPNQVLIAIARADVKAGQPRQSRRDAPQYV